MIPVRLIGVTTFNWKTLSEFFQDRGLSSPNLRLDTSPMKYSSCGQWAVAMGRNEKQIPAGMFATFAIDISSSEAHVELINANLNGIEINELGHVIKIIGAPISTWVNFILVRARKTESLPVRQLAVGLYLELNKVYHEPFLDYRLNTEGYLER